MRYDPELSPFAAVAPGATAGAWGDLAELVGPGGTAVFAGAAAPPDGWTRVFGLEGFQLVAETLESLPADPDIVLLGPEDAAEALELADRTKPGPFLLRTVELGGYLGVRHDGRLIAMAGERMHPAGFTEISAVCTDDAFRGRGLAGRLVRAVAAAVAERGETPFLHVAGSNTGAIRLYRALGFREHREISFEAWTAPGIGGEPAPLPH